MWDSRKMTTCKFQLMLSMLVLALSVTAGDNTTSDGQATDVWDEFRLPKFVEPIRYHLKIHPNIQQSSFRGQTEMTLKSVQATDMIVFHAKDLDIDPEIRLRTSEKNGAKTVIESGNITKHQMYYVKFSPVVQPNVTLILTVRYNGTIGEDPLGLYRSKYVYQGETRFIISTQMQPTYARRVFPCLDEPEFKAIFSMELDATGNDVALFNTEQVSQSPGTNCVNASDCTTHRFKSTYRMSTYLVAFAVGRFEYKFKCTESGYKVFIWYRPGKEKEAVFGLEAAFKVIGFFQEFFAMEIPLQRLDMLAVPKHGSAMENTGLNIYKESFLLYNSESTPENWRILITEIISHEVVHEWFGNIVTLAWWDELYINEGFAKYLSVFGMPSIDNKIKVDEYLDTYRRRSLSEGSWSTALPIKREVTSDAETRAVFSAVTYYQTACLLRMLESVIGLDAMKAGLRQTLQDHKFGNVHGTDIWTALDEVATTRANVNVNNVMHGWLTKPGYPVVSIARRNDQVLLSQERFLYVQPDQRWSRETIFGQTWEIPFTFRVSSSPNNQISVWLTNRQQRESVANLANATWLIGNVRSKGLYRVNYDTDNWRHLAEQLVTDHHVFYPGERTVLLDDAFSLARTNALDYPTAFNMLRYLTLEDKYEVWYAVVLHLNYIGDSLLLEEEYPLMVSYMRNHLIQPKLRQLGWDMKTGDLNTRTLRKRLIVYSTREEFFTNDLMELFRAWKENSSVTIDPDVKHELFYQAVQLGSRQDWELIFSRAFDPSTSENRNHLRIALTTSRDPEQLHRLLHFCLTKEQWDMDQVLCRVSSNDNGRYVAWTFFRQHWATLLAKYESKFMSRLFRFLVQHNEDFDLKEIKDFHKKKDLGESKASYNQAIEEVRANVQWQMTRKEEVIAWLRRTMEPWTNCGSSYYVFPVPPSFPTVNSGAPS